MQPDTDTETERVSTGLANNWHTHWILRIRSVAQQRKIKKKQANAADRALKKFEHAVTEMNT